MVGFNGLADQPTRQVRRFRKRVSSSPFADQFVEHADDRVQVSFADDDRKLLTKLLESHAQLAREFRRDREERKKEDDRREGELIELRAASKLAHGEIEDLKTDKVRMQAVSGVILLIGAGLGTVATILATMLIQFMSKQFFK